MKGEVLDWRKFHQFPDLTLGDHVKHVPVRFLLFFVKFIHTPFLPGKKAALS